MKKYFFLYYGFLNFLQRRDSDQFCEDDTDDAAADLTDEDRDDKIGLKIHAEGQPVAEAVAGAYDKSDGKDFAFRFHILDQAE